MSSGNRKIYRLSRKGNRRLNFATHLAALTQIRHQHSDGRAYDEKKIAEGTTHQEALRTLQRRVSDAIYAALAAGPRQAAALPGAREGNRGTTLSPGRPVHTPSTGSSDKPLPGLAPPYGPPPSPAAAAGSPTTSRSPASSPPPAAPARHRPSKQAVATAAGDSSRTTHTRNHRPKTTSNKPSRTS